MTSKAEYTIPTIEAQIEAWKKLLSSSNSQEKESLPGLIDQTVQSIEFCSKKENMAHLCNEWQALSKAVVVIRSNLPDGSQDDNERMTVVQKNIEVIAKTLIVLNNSPPLPPPPTSQSMQGLNSKQTSFPHTLRYLAVAITELRKSKGAFGEDFTKQFSSFEACEHLFTNKQNSIQFVSRLVFLGWLLSNSDDKDTPEIFPSEEMLKCEGDEEEAISARIRGRDEPFLRGILEATQEQLIDPDVIFIVTRVETNSILKPENINALLPSIQTFFEMEAVVSKHNVKPKGIGQHTLGYIEKAIAKLKDSEWEGHVKEYAAFSDCSSRFKGKEAPAYVSRLAFIGWLVSGNTNDPVPAIFPSIILNMISLPVMNELRKRWEKNPALLRSLLQVDAECWIELNNAQGVDLIKYVAKTLAENSTLTEPQILASMTEIENCFTSTPQQPQEDEGDLQMQFSLALSSADLQKADRCVDMMPRDDQQAIMRNMVFDAYMKDKDFVNAIKIGLKHFEDICVELFRNTVIPKDMRETEFGKRIKTKKYAEALKIVKGEPDQKLRDKYLMELIPFLKEASMTPLVLSAIKALSEQERKKYSDINPTVQDNYKVKELETTMVAFRQSMGYILDNLPSLPSNEQERIRKTLLGEMAIWQQKLLANATLGDVGSLDKKDKVN